MSTYKALLWLAVDTDDGEYELKRSVELPAHLAIFPGLCLQIDGELRDVQDVTYVVNGDHVGKVIIYLEDYKDNSPDAISYLEEKGWRKSFPSN